MAIAPLNKRYLLQMTNTHTDIAEQIVTPSVSYNYSVFTQWVCEQANLQPSKQTWHTSNWLLLYIWLYCQSTVIDSSSFRFSVSLGFQSQLGFLTSGNPQYMTHICICNELGYFFTVW